MSKPVITKYHGVKYSLRPHGLKSRLIVFKRSVLVGVSAFIVAFGGALLAASPAQGNPGDCFVEVSATPQGASPSYSPAPNSTLCLAPPPTVTVTVTQTVTASALPAQTVTETVTAMATVMKTVVVTETETKTVTETVEAKPTQSAPVTPKPSAIPSKTPSPSPVAGSGKGSLVPWGIGVAGLTGAGLAIAGIVGIVKRRRYQGSHAVYDDDEYYSPEGYDSVGISSDYKYDPDDTTVIPSVPTDTQVIPKVEPDDDHQAGK